MSTTTPALQPGTRVRYNDPYARHVPYTRYGVVRSCSGGQSIRCLVDWETRRPSTVSMIFLEDVDVPHDAGGGTRTDSELAAEV